VNPLSFLERFQCRSAIVVLWAVFLPFTCSAAIRYEVSLAHPEYHLFRVTMLIPDVSGEVTVQIPAWNALYQIRDFSSHLQDVEAYVGAEKVPILRVDKLTWRITASGTVRVQYASYWDEPGPFSTQLNGEHAFINLAMILMYAIGSQKEKVALNFGDFPHEWRAEGALLEGCKVVFDQPLCREDAGNYDELVDAPIEIGKFDEFDLSGMSPRITVAVHGDNWQKKKIEELLTRICQYEIKIMEGAPFEHYTFILHIGKSASGKGGGMEHANSTAIFVPSDEFLAAVGAHEFFHLWNVKRIRPASLEPVDYTKEQYSRALWFSEGVTNTYGSFTLARTGIWNKQQFYEDLGEQITEIEARSANRWQSAEESSLDAWLEKYAIYNQPDMSVSYYTKGQILGVLLDIVIRDRADNRKSLDDVLRDLNSNFAKQGRFYRESDDIRAAAEKVSGASFEEFFRQYVAGTIALPYENILDLAGLKLRRTQHKRGTLGFAASRDTETGLIVRSVEAESFAGKAGLHTGDVILKWNNGGLPRRPERWAVEQNPGNMLRVTVRRDEKELTLEFRLGEATETYFQVEENPHASEKARRIRDGLLRGETQAGGSN
jgi:predicted metalloprotease with PDZ domain